MGALTFNEQLLLMVIDKAVIALLILGFVYFGQKKLESYKARQVVWAETAKERLKHIALEWDEMNKWDCMVGDTLYQIVQIMVARDPKLASNLSSHGMRPNLSETFAVLSRASADDIKKLLENPPENLARAIAASIGQGRLLTMLYKTIASGWERICMSIVVSFKLCSTQFVLRLAPVTWRL